MTARWVVEDVAPQRDLSITWQPISLFLKNRPAPQDRGFERYWFTHRLLRVMEATRASSGDDAVFPLYWEYGRRIHHDRELPFAAVEALNAVGLDVDLADAFDDEAWDAEIGRRMDMGLALAGVDIGTPIIGMEGDNGAMVGIFGPVITRVPAPERSLQIWDAVVMLTRADGFWELKRNRTERPEMPAAPERIVPPRNEAQ